MRRRALWGLGVALVLVPVATLAGLRVNTSPSLPRGLYRQIPLNGRPLARGDLVLACPPLPAALLARSRGYLPPGPCPGEVEPIGKVVLAIAGEAVAVDAEGVSVDGEHVPWSRPLSHDGRGRPLPSLIGRRYTLAAGEVWLFSPRHPRSFDSRVFGPISGKAVRGRLVPLWVEDADFRMRKSEGSR